MRWALVGVLLLGVSSACADEAVSEPSALVCNDFRGVAERALASGPDAIQVNNLLFDAARKGCALSLTRLFEAGASRLARDRHGDTALAIAARAGRKAIVEALIAGASPEERQQIDAPDAAGSTPLMLAIVAGRGAVARVLLQAGARIDAVNRQGETALSAAAFAGDEDLAENLIERGAKPDTVDRSGRGPICYAAARGGARLVTRLVAAGVDPSARYGSDLTALMWAAGHADATPAARAAATVKALLAHGAKPDLVDDRGRSALMIAASLDHLAAARALIEAGADRDLGDKQGKSAMDLAASDEMRALLAAR